VKSEETKDKAPTTAEIAPIQPKPEESKVSATAPATT
jgi:hypothetical protein